MPRPVHFDISAENPERAVKFYGDVFGWTFQKWDGPMDYWLVTTGANGELGIDGGLSRRNENSNGTVNTVAVPSADEYLERVTQAGGKVIMPKNAIPGVGWFAMCADTEGNSFGIMEGDPQAQ
jgi:predicted enzyme related to lactoylglutathione lyase